MKIISKTAFEEIHVLHNNFDEMSSNLDQLRKEGWSDNTRISFTGAPLVRKRISDVEDFKKSHPGVTIHKDESWFPSPHGHYVLYTTHTRELEE